MASAGVQSGSSYRRGHRRFQSVMAQTFSSELDDVFNMDSGLDTLVGDVEAKRQSIFVQQRELEELQERIRQAELQLKSSDDEEEDQSSEGEVSSESDDAGVAAGKAPARSPTKAMHRSWSTRQPSIFAIRETKDEEIVIPKPVAPVQRAPAPVPAKRDFVMVRRPRPNMRKTGRVDSAHIEETTEEEEEDEEEEEESTEESSEEE